MRSPQEHLNRQDMQEQLARDSWKWTAAALVALAVLGSLLVASALWPRLVGESVILNQIVEGMR